jgi:hypothetical protein
MTYYLIDFVCTILISVISMSLGFTLAKEKYGGVPTKFSFRAAYIDIPREAFSFIRSSAVKKDEEENQ